MLKKIWKEFVSIRKELQAIRSSVEYIKDHPFNVLTDIRLPDHGASKAKKEIHYLCNGKKPDCSKRGCYKRGGDCRHTKDIEYALDFEKQKCSNSIHYMEEIPQKAKYSIELSSNDCDMERIFDGITEIVNMKKRV